jgi:hypothetical protein
MTQWQRRSLIAGASVRTLWTGVLFTIAIGAVVSTGLGEDRFWDSWAPIWSIMIGEGLSIAYSWRLYRRAIPRIEQATAAQDWDTAPQVI